MPILRRNPVFGEIPNFGNVQVAGKEACAR
jgi:hypothetical protein